MPARAAATKVDQAEIDRVSALDTEIAQALRVLRNIEGRRAVSVVRLDEIGRIPAVPVARMALEQQRDNLAAALAEYLRQADVLDEASRRNLDNQEMAAAAGDMDMAALQGERGLEIVQWQADNAAHIEETRAALDSIDGRIAALVEQETAEQERRSALVAEVAAADAEHAEQRQLLDELYSELDAAQARVDADYAYLDSGERPRIFRSE